MIPPAAIIIPFFVGMQKVGLYDSLLAVILAETAFILPLGILIMRGYVDTLPIELNEAARVDGATEWRAFRHVVLPLLRAPIATVALFITLSTWNGFLLPLVLFNNPLRATLTVGLSSFNGRLGAIDAPLLAAASVMAIVPILVVFVAARRYFVDGLSLGAIKG
jgi:ABC-type glycerol-3-phosphate transport system permease component